MNLNEFRIQELVHFLKFDAINKKEKIAIERELAKRSDIRMQTRTKSGFPGL